MTWVRATRCDGEVIWVNMARVWVMTQQMVDDQRLTALVAGASKTDAAGKLVPVYELVRETPGELLSDDKRV